MKVLVAIGTRPEAIKLAPVIVALRAHAETVVCTTGQHPELAAEALATFGLSPDVALPPVESGRTLNRLAAAMLDGLDPVLAEVRPDWVLVQGDTTSALIAGFAAFHRGIRVGHVEAGLRTHDRSAPFPEEANRQMLGRLARLHFVSTETAGENLGREGIDARTIVSCGNTVVDAVELVRRGWDGNKRDALAASLALSDGPLVIVTCHRRENQTALADICGAVRRVAQRHPRHHFLFPVHRDPAIQAVVGAELGATSNVILHAPLGYEETLYALEQCALVITDSGGLQEEVACFHKPVIVLRERTERMEGVDAGFATLAGHDPALIEAAAANWLADDARRAGLARIANPYGDGRAAARIVAALLDPPGIE